jgi:hypothetical protein
MNPAMEIVIEDVSASLRSAVFTQIVGFPWSPDPLSKVLPTLPLVEAGVDDVGGSGPTGVVRVLVSSGVYV